MENSYDNRSSRTKCGFFSFFFFFFLFFFCFFLFLLFSFSFFSFFSFLPLLFFFSFFFLLSFSIPFLLFFTFLLPYPFSCMFIFSFFLSCGIAIRLNRNTWYLTICRNFCTLLLALCTLANRCSASNVSESNPAPLSNQGFTNIELDAVKINLNSSQICLENHYILKSRLQTSPVRVRCLPTGF